MIVGFIRRSSYGRYVCISGGKSDVDELKLAMSDQFVIKCNVADVDWVIQRSCHVDIWVYENAKLPG